MNLLRETNREEWSAPFHPRCPALSAHAQPLRWAQHHQYYGVSITLHIDNDEGRESIPRLAMEVSQRNPNGRRPERGGIIADLRPYHQVS